MRTTPKELTAIAADRRLLLVLLVLLPTLGGVWMFANTLPFGGTPTGNRLADPFWSAIHLAVDRSLDGADRLHAAITRQ